VTGLVLSGADLGEPGLGAEQYVRFRVLGLRLRLLNAKISRRRYSTALQKKLFAIRYSPFAVVFCCRFSSSQVAPFRFAICLHRFCFSRLQERLSPKL
jgi:hypothetical protein